MSKYIPTKLTQLSANEAAAVDVINKNLDSIKEHIDDSVSRSAKSPSQMQADLDMNGKKIINIGKPTNDTDLVRKIDVVESEAAIKQMADAVQTVGTQVVEAAAAASNAAVEAVDSAAAAEAWATKMDGPVEDDKYSSRYYAENIGADVHTVAEIAEDVTTVAGKKNEVTTVAGIASDVSTVAGIASDVSAVEDIASDVPTVASNVSDVSSVADDITKVAAVADDLTNIDSVADDLTNIDAVAGNQANIDAVAGNATNINTVAGDSMAINSVASDLTNVDAVNANKTNIDTVAENIGDIRDKVSKTGDTMTGILTMSADTQDQIVMALPSLSKGTNPSATIYRGIYFNDENNLPQQQWKETRLAHIETSVDTSGTVTTSLGAIQNTNDGNASTSIVSASITSAGVASCSFPNTKRVDGQWVKETSTIASGISGDSSYSNTFTVTDLPNDGNSYEVLLMAFGRTGTASGNACQVWVSSSILTNSVNVFIAMTRSSSYVAGGGAVIIPVSSDRKITMTFSSSLGTNSNVGLQMKAYRRIGTNS